MSRIRTAAAPAARPTRENTATILYSLKMILFSLAASVPAWFAHKYFVSQFGAMGRLLGNGLPLLLTAAVFGAIGIALLFVTRDRVAFSFLKRK